MKTAILGWGSLTWDQHELPKCSGDWQTGGPKLKLEFSRVSASRSGALTLVIDPTKGEECEVQFSVSAQTELADAICDLRTRESTVVKRIGFVDLLSGQQRANVYPPSAELIRIWAGRRGFDAVVWTDLPSNFETEAKKAFTVENALLHLKSLDEAGTKRAREYIIRAPAEIDTPLRRAITADAWLAR